MHENFNEFFDLFKLLFNRLMRNTYKIINKNSGNNILITPRK